MAVVTIVPSNCPLFHRLGLLTAAAKTRACRTTYVWSDTLFPLRFIDHEQVHHNYCGKEQAQRHI